MAPARGRARPLGPRRSARLGEWFGEKSAVLEFETVIDGLQLNGVDMIHWDDSDRIVRFKVMVRPFKALQTLIPLMAKQLER